jgi:3,4-dihydroxy 2-butanone 4-phosphate synthase/GTP cyclohydrolase II
MTDNITAAIRAIAAGELVVVTDDDDRENEGDLIMAASLATPEKLAFMIRYTSGIICAPLPRSEARRLRLDPMVAENEAPLGTAFTVSVDFRHGLTTGISAEERCNTVRALANRNAGADEFVRPGHVFPLIAREGGVLMRSGHTEAGVDLCRLAGLAPVGVLAELVNDDGTVMRGPEIAAFAQKHRLNQVSVAELIAHRQRSEKLVTRVAEFPIVTLAGPARAVAYRTAFDPVEHLAVVFGEIKDGRGVPVRLHREAIIEDVFAARSKLDRVMARFSAGRGVIVYLREGAVGVAGAGGGRTRDAHLSPEEAHGTAAARQREWREVGLGAQILADLGIGSIRLLATRERRYVGLAGFGIAIEATDILEG